MKTESARILPLTTKRGGRYNSTHKADSGREISEAWLWWSHWKLPQQSQASKAFPSWPLLWVMQHSAEQSDGPRACVGEHLWDYPASKKQLTNMGYTWREKLNQFKYKMCLFHKKDIISPWIRNVSYATLQVLMIQVFLENQHWREMKRWSTNSKEQLLRMLRRKTSKLCNYWEFLCNF